MKLLCLIACCGLALSTAHATPVTSLIGTVVGLPSYETSYYYGTDPQPMAPGITWSATATSLFAYNQYIGFSKNGLWGGNPPFTFLSNDTGSIRFTFDSPVAAVGGFVNQSSNYDSSLAIYGSGGNLLESSLLNVVTEGGEFHGFQWASNSISVFELKDGYVGLRSLTFAYAPLAAVPEPDTYALLLAGLGLVAGIARRRFQRPALMA